MICRAACQACSGWDSRGSWQSHECRIQRDTRSLACRLPCCAPPVPALVLPGQTPPIVVCRCCPEGVSRSRRRRRYPSDMSDAEWAVCEPVLPHPAWLAGKGGRPSGHCMRDVVDGIRYLTHNGPGHRALPPTTRRDPVQRLLRTADSEELPARQRVPDLPGLPVRPGVPTRTARTASPHAHPHRGLHRQGPDPRRGDEPAGSHQPRPDDRRDRQRREIRGRRCGLTTLNMSSRLPSSGLSKPASAPSPRCAAWTPPVSASPSTPSAVRLACPDPGSTPRRTCAPRSNGSASDIPPRHQPQVPPQRQRASDTSLLRRLEAATARIRQLEADNQQLRGALARTLGERRAADVLGETGRRDTPNRNTSKLIGPC